MTRTITQNARTGLPVVSPLPDAGNAFGDLAERPWDMLNTLLTNAGIPGSAVMIQHANGNITSYQPTADTNAARGVALAAAEAAAVAGDTVWIGSGTFDLGTSDTTPFSFAGVRHQGAGKYQTYVHWSGAPGDMSLPACWVANGGDFADLQINLVHTAVYQYGISPRPGATVRMQRVKITGGTDGIYFRMADGDSSTETLYLDDCEIETQYDCVANDVYAVLVARNCRFAATYFDPGGGGSPAQRCVALSTSANYHFTNCEFTATSTQPSGDVQMVAGIYANTETGFTPFIGTRIYIENCSISISFIMTPAAYADILMSGPTITYVSNTTGSGSDGQVTYTGNVIFTDGAAVGQRIAGHGSLLPIVVSSSSLPQGVCAAAKLSLVNGNAFADFGSSDLADKVDKFLIVTDSAGKRAGGWIKAAGTAETFGTNLLANPTFDSVTTGWTYSHLTAASVAGGQSNNCLQLAKASGSPAALYATFASVPGTLYKRGFYAKAGTDANIEIALSNNAGMTISEGFAPTAGWVLHSIYRAELSTDANPDKLKITFTGLSTNETVLLDEAFVQAVLTPAATGVTIVSTKAGATFNWAFVDSGFDPNDVVMSYRVFPCQPGLLTLDAGTAAGRPALAFAAGTLNTTPQAGAVEYDGTHFYFVDSTGVRHQFAVEAGP